MQRTVYRPPNPTLLGRVRWKWSGGREVLAPGEHSTGWVSWREARVQFAMLASRDDVRELHFDRLGDR